jgi:hypothetical protein
MSEQADYTYADPDEAYAAAQQAIAKEVDDSHGPLSFLNANFLSFADWGLTHLPPEIVSLTHLTWLNLSGNQLQQLPGEFGNLTALTWLNLSGNQLQQLPGEFGNLTALTRLDLGDNQLQQLPAEIANLTALTHLFLSGNRLQQLPDEIATLAALTHLSLSGNQLHQLPDAIANLTALTWLDLSDNQLQELPDAIANLTALTHLFLNGNLLQQLPARLERRNRYKAFDISGNPVAQGLPANIIVSQPRTIRRYLDLSVAPEEWVGRSDLASFMLQRRSRCAVLETVSMVGAVLAAAAHGSSQLLWTATCLAPLLLLRTSESETAGVRAFGTMMGRLRIRDGKYGEEPIRLAGKLLLLGLGSVAIRIGVAAWHILRHPIRAIRAMPGNLERQITVIDHNTPPELVPGMEQAYAKNGPARVLTSEELKIDFRAEPEHAIGYRQEGSSSDTQVGQRALGVFLFFAWLYRFSVKASAVVWWPFLCFGARQDPALLLKRLHDGKPWGWLAMAGPSGLFVAIFAAALYLLLAIKGDGPGAAALAGLIPDKAAALLPGVVILLTQYPPPNFDLRWSLGVLAVIGLLGIATQVQKALLTYMVRSQHAEPPAPAAHPVALNIFEGLRHLGNLALVAWFVLMLSWALPYTSQALAWVAGLFA